MKVCYYFKIWLLFLAQLNLVLADLPPPQSPCPADFTYEPRKPASDKWYGVVLIKSDVPLTGLRVEIQLTHPALVLGNWDGTVSTRDNQLFQILNLDKTIQPGPATAVRFFVKYEDKPNSIIPALQSIRVNGRMICPQVNAPTTIPPSTPSINRAQLYESSISNHDRVIDTRTSSATTTNRPTISTSNRVQINESPIPNPDRVEYNVPVNRVFDTKTSTDSEIPLKERPLNQGNEGSCGRVAIRPRPLITFGQKTARGQWPWHGAVYKSVGVDLTYICGTSLIHSQVALTAAHCVTSKIRNAPIEPENLLIYFGKYHLKIWSEGGVQDKQVKSILIHPNFSLNTLESDIAILILNSPTEYTDFVRPVCLWDRNKIDLQYVEGQLGTIIGWGFDQKGHPTEELMQAKMPVVSQQQCLWSYPEFFAKFTNNQTFCAGFSNGEQVGTSVCNGDSGGGLVFKEKNYNGEEYWKLRGLVSVSVSQKGEEVCDTKHYVVFTDVAKYLDWIYNIINGNIESKGKYSLDEYNNNKEDKSKLTLPSGTYSNNNQEIKYNNNNNNNDRILFNNERAVG